VHVLVVAATAAEVAPVVSQLRHTANRSARVTRYSGGGHDIDVLISGVGMVATAAWTSRELNRERYDLALNLGVCGSFNRLLEPGRVVHVVSDRLVELGAEDGDAFLTIHELKLLGDDEFPFQQGRLVNAAPPAHRGLTELTAVDGITVNTVHGDERSIACVVERFKPDVETMEGAGFMYACLIHGIPFAQIRAVSNAVERRNRGAWKMDVAIRQLGAAAARLLDQ
jgi:futalosine hydrolase